MSAETENKAIIIQVGPEVDIQSLNADKVGHLILKYEAGAAVELLRLKKILPPHGKLTVSYGNEDLGEKLGKEVEYPFIQIGDNYYKVIPDNNN